MQEKKSRNCRASDAVRARKARLNRHRRRFGLMIGAALAMVVVGAMATQGMAQAANIITVTTLSDPTGASGTCSLREAITNANKANQSGSANCAAGTGTDEIVFASGLSGTITLGSALPNIVHTLTIDGGGNIAVSGDNAYQVMYVNSGATLALDNITIEDGNFPFGGGINNVGTLTVTNSTFSGNSASTAGGINNIGGDGGGINNGGTLTVTNSTFSGNSSLDGGGIINGGTLTVTNSTFSGNNAGTNGDGGGIANDSGTLTVTNSTFSGNSAGTGGGVYKVGGTVTLEGTIVAGSSGGNCGGSVADGGYNISSDNTCVNGGTGSVSDYTGSILSSAGLADNGGPTETIALDTSNTSNPAIDVIPVADCPATDQRGYTRPDEGESFCDIGAYESGATGPLTFSSTTKLELEPSTGSFDLYSGFTIAGGTIDPATEPVTLQIGSYSVTIPAGQFLLRGSKDAYVFEGVIGGVSLQLRILPTGDGSYTLQAEGSGADLSGITTNPVTVTLTIGSSSGSTSATAQFE